ncbi:MAG: AAC(3) family N-acetyltransferase [Bacteroidota bacterium]
MRKILLKILPQSLIDLYKSNKKRSRLQQREQLLKKNEIVTEAQITAMLQHNGLKTGDTIMVHSSLSKIGYVEHGANTLINALLQTIGPEGTLMMPAFPAVGYNYDYLKTDPVFDVKQTPSKMGIVTETFRKQNHALRSLHPTDSVSAIGKQAHYLVKDHFGQLTPYNASSPFYRLCELKGKILMIGVDLNSLTNLHTLEDAVNDFEYPVYHKTLFTTSLIDETGKKVSMQTKVHDPVYSKKRRCNDLMPHFEKAGFLTHFKIGQANCMLINADKMHEWMVENYRTKGITMYTPNGK